MVTTFRIFKTEHARNWFDGRGSFLYGGRWNSSGVRVIYTAATLSLAALEMLVYIYDKDLIDEYSWAPVEFDEAFSLPVESIGRLPEDWRIDLTFSSLRAIGDRWVSSNMSAVLRVPTAIVPNEFNYIINPAHPDFKKISFGRVQDFVFDQRLTRN